MNFTATVIAEFLKGTIEGNPEVEVNNISKIEEGKPGTLSFLANPKYNHYLYETESSIVLINNDFKLEKGVSATLIRVPNAYEAFASLLELYQQNRFNPQGISEKSSISETAQTEDDLYLGDFSVIGDCCKIGKNVKIYHNVTIGENVTIGDNTVIRSGVHIYYDSIIGKNCYVHSGSVIGADGFGFAPQKNGEYKKIPQVGNVILEDDVEIGANACIDRATLGSTILRKGVKIDNLIQIAHNVEIGENTVVAAQTGISGSTKIGKQCMIGGQVGIVGHLKVADGSILAAQAGLNKDIKKSGEILQGTPAIPIRNFQKSAIHYKNLPDLVLRLQALEQEIKKMKDENQDA